MLRIWGSAKLSTALEGIVMSSCSSASEQIRLSCLEALVSSWSLVVLQHTDFALPLPLHPLPL